MLYHLIFTAWFNRNIKSLRKRNAKLRQDFQAFLNEFDAEAHPIISGTGGARKARVKAQGRGKRGSYRIIYYFAMGDKVWLITIYDKVQKDDLSETEKKKIYGLIQQIKKNR